MPNSGTSRPSEPMFERDEREREETEIRTREVEYQLHKQQQQHQQQQQQMHYMMQQPQQQQQHTPTRSLPHNRSDTHIGPGQGPQLPPPQTYNSSGGHHHHHVHHHHVHHHHHNSGSAPPPYPYDRPRHAPSRELEPPRASAPEIINLPSAPNASLPLRQWEREREPPSPRHP